MREKLWTLPCRDPERAPKTRMPNLESFVGPRNWPDWCVAKSRPLNFKEWGRKRSSRRKLMCDQGLPQATSRCAMVRSSFPRRCCAGSLRRASALRFESGKPWQNGVNESFYGKFRDECLSIAWFRLRRSRSYHREFGVALQRRAAAFEPWLSHGHLVKQRAGALR